MTTTRAVQIGFLISGITSATTGNPVAGGEVFFYAAGTTTQKYVYTEKEKTNGYYSYDLDAVGAATLYGDGAYKIVVKDADGATVKTLDNMLLRYEYYGVQNVSSTPYSHTSDHDIFLVDTTVGDITINMLAADLWDRPIKVMRTAGTDNIIINPDGSETIDGAATLTISSDAIVEIISDGSNLVSVGFRSNMFDADNDTGVQVEEGTDDDTIRFDTGGTERVTITTTKVTSNIPVQFNSHQDADGDTKVQVEETADEDKVRIDTGGVQKALFSGTATESYVQVNSHQDADGDTKIQVEESADEDRVRIDTGGTQRVVVDSSGLNIVSGTLLIGSAAAFTRTVYTAGGAFSGTNNVIISTTPYTITMTWGQLSHDIASTRTSAAIIPSALRPSSSFHDVYFVSGDDVSQITITTSGAFSIGHTDVSTGLPVDKASAQAGTITWTV